MKPLDLSREMNDATPERVARALMRPQKTKESEDARLAKRRRAQLEAAQGPSPKPYDPLTQ